MTTELTSNSIIEEIVYAAKSLSTEEQKMFLRQMNAAKLLRKKKPIVRAKNPKPLTMKQIDAIKHKARKVCEYAD